MQARRFSTVVTFSLVSSGFEYVSQSAKAYMVTDIGSMDCRNSTIEAFRFYFSMFAKFNLENKRTFPVMDMITKIDKMIGNDFFIFPISL